MGEQIPEGYSLIETNELERLKAVDAKHGWKERPVQLLLHHFEPHRRWPWFCGKCGYAPHEPLQHYQAEPPTNNVHAQEDFMSELREALEQLLHAVCGETGFAAAVRNDSGTAYPWPALDIAEEAARAALAAHPVEAEALEDVKSRIYALRLREVQMLHAAFSTRNWHDAEVAGNQLRDKLDALITEWKALSPARSGMLSAEKEVG